ncbi:MAG: ribbon-helix-helix protein, CopG family [Gemmatimonadota bacterium]
MKPIQVMIDPDLLAELDATAEVQRDGRSAVLRTAVTEYLSRQRQAAIRNQYRRAYADSRDLGPEFAEWEEQGAWPAA